MTPAPSPRRETLAEARGHDDRPDDRPEAEGREEHGCSLHIAAGRRPSRRRAGTSRAETRRGSRGRRDRRGPAGTARPRTTLTPALRLSRTLPSPRSPSARRAGAQRSATMTAKKERRRSGRSRRPRRACRTRSRARTGPMTRARLNWIEFSATAFGRSSRSTSVGTSAW